MPLHLQQHKSYHPYSRDNIERVRRDEEAARLEEEGNAQQSLLAQSEARLEALKRRRHGSHGSQDRQDRLKAAEREIDGKRGALEAFDARQKDAVEGEAGPSGREEASTSDGHINFWADEEHVQRKRRPGNDAVAPRGKRKGNSEYEADKMREKQRWEEQNTMFLGKPVKELHPWYQSEDLQSSEERKRSHEQKLEAA